MSLEGQALGSFGSAEFRAPLVIKFGWGVLGASLPEVLAELGIRRPLLITDPNVGKLRLVLEAVERASSSVPFAGVFNGIPHEPTTREVEAALAAYLASGADGIVAIGGGSVMDTAKAASMLATNGGTLADYYGANRFPRQGAPLIAVPTTAGTGSEVTRFTVITDPETHAKLLITDRKMIPSAAVVDPSLTVTVPAEVTANTGIDALTHAIEAYVSVKANPMSDTLALSAIRRMAWSLPLAFAEPEDRGARTGAALGALEAGLAFCNASVALVHGMARPLGVFFGVPHGASNAMLLPTVSAFSLSAAPQRYGDIAKAMGSDTQGLDSLAAARQGVDAIKQAVQRGADPDPGRVRHRPRGVGASGAQHGLPGHRQRQSGQQPAHRHRRGDHRAVHAGVLNPDSIAEE